VVGNKKGVFLLLQQAKVVSTTEWQAAQPQPLDPPKVPADLKPTGPDGKPLDLGFETGSLANWEAAGTAFDAMPVKGDAVARRRTDMRSGHRGEFWVGSFETHGDPATGSLTSVAFPVTQPFASFLIGGGSTPQTRVEVVNAANGVLLFQATGPDNEEMKRVFLDLRRFHGASIRLRLVDEAKTGWGHLNFDDFLFHDGPPPKADEVRSTNP
jgi:hypothetical protein